MSESYQPELPFLATPFETEREFESTPAWVAEVNGVTVIDLGIGLGPMNTEQTIATIERAVTSTTKWTREVAIIGEHFEPIATSSLDLCVDLAEPFVKHRADLARYLAVLMVGAATEEISRNMKTGKYSEPDDLWNYPPLLVKRLSDFWADLLTDESEWVSDFAASWFGETKEFDDTPTHSSQYNVLIWELVHRLRNARLQAHPATDERRRCYSR